MMTQTTPQTNQNQNQNQNQTRSAAQPPSAPQANAQPALETKPAPVIEMTEAPYSWNVSAQDENGFVEMFTVRAVSEKGFLERVARVKQMLADANYKPAPTRGAYAASSAGSSAAQSANDANADAAPTCGIHGTPMQKRQGKNGAFWSCPQKFANGNYCNYKAPKG